MFSLNSTTGDFETFQDYFFSVPEEIVEISINLDGSVDMEYWISFKVEKGGSPIDIMDIGFYNKHYKLGTVVVDVNGTSVTDI